MAGIESFTTQLSSAGSNRDFDGTEVIGLKASFQYLTPAERSEALALAQGWNGTNGFNGLIEALATASSGGGPSEGGACYALARGTDDSGQRFKISHCPDTFG
jgi:hypothetical protein